MKKFLFFVAALLFMATPVMAVSDVTITSSNQKVGDVNWVTVSYESDTNRIRAFGLDITVYNPDGNIIDVCDVNAYYRIFPGQIDFIDGDINSTGYGTPYPTGDLNDANVVIEMGSLYTFDTNYIGDPNAGYGKQPPLSGTLLKFGFKNACDYKVDVNVARGGIVMEDAYEMPSLDSPLTTGTLCGIPSDYNDYGDAPDTYLTLLASNGPRHKMAGPEAGIGPKLGALIDSELNGVPTPLCTGDDAAPPLDDEDDIGALVLVKGSPGSVTVAVSGAGGYLNAWIDFGQDGSFAQAGDQIFTNQAVVVPTNNLGFVIPANAVVNSPLPSRWRVTSYTLPAGQYFGLATDGEVEDHNVAVVCPPLPDPPTGPSPANAVKCVATDANLIWTPGANTATQDVYLGTSNPPVTLVAADIPVGTTLYDPPANLNYYTCYFWRINEKNACGQVTVGPVWAFRTGPLNKLWPCCQTCLGDVSGDGWVKTGDITALDIILDPAVGNRYQYTAPQYKACGDYNQDGWNKTGDITLIDILLDPLVGNRKICPTCP